MPMSRPIFEMIQPLILASASPRRQQYLADLGICFDIAVADILEVLRQDEGPDDFVLRLAREKAESVARNYPDTWVLGADTVVVLNNQILGKPTNVADAKAMLQKLSGKWHAVWTGFCILNPTQKMAIGKAVKTEVLFVDLNDSVIDAYIATGEPMDKAGSYGIQGEAGCFVKEIRGSYSNIVGLPLAEVIAQLMDFGIIKPTVLHQST